jgi:hypothetical protein
MRESDGRLDAEDHTPHPIADAPQENSDLPGLKISCKE